MDEVKIIFPEKSPLKIDVEVKNSGTRNYNALSNRPKINGVMLEGDKSSPQLKLQDKMDTLTPTEIEKILYLG